MRYCNALLRSQSEAIWLVEFEICTHSQPIRKLETEFMIGENCYNHQIGWFTSYSFMGFHYVLHYVFHYVFHYAFHYVLHYVFHYIIHYVLHCVHYVFHYVLHYIMCFTNALCYSCLRYKFTIQSSTMKMCATNSLRNWLLVECSIARTWSRVFKLKLSSCKLFNVEKIGELFL